MLSSAVARHLVNDRTERDTRPHSTETSEPAWRFTAMSYARSVAAAGTSRSTILDPQPLHAVFLTGSRAMNAAARRALISSSLLGTLLCCTLLPAVEPTPPRSSLSQPRTGHTQKFGSGTLTHRSDGTSSRTRPFGSGSLTTERTRDGKTITGHTQNFGSRTVTRWSDGSTSESRPFGSGSLTTERGPAGQTVTGHTRRFGSGTITNRSDGSSTRSEKVGNGTLQRDRPARKSR